MPRTKYEPTPLSDNPLSRYLRQWLDEHNLSRVKAAQRWGISHGTLRNIEAGIELTTKQPYRPRLATLRLLAKGMGVPLDTLIKLQGEEMEPPPSPAASAPTLAAIADLLDRKHLSLLEHEAALGRDALCQQLACFKEVRDALADIRRQGQKHGLGARDRKRLQAREQELQRLLDHAVERQADFHEHLAILLPAVDKDPGSEVSKVTQLYVARMRELLRQLGNGTPRPALAPAAPRGIALFPRPEEQGNHEVIIHERAACGPPDLRDEHILGTLLVDKSEVGGATHMVEASGESMIGAGILDGDQVFYIHTEHPRVGDIVLAAADGGVTIKHLRWDDEEENYFLEAANPDKGTYPDIPWASDSRIFGVVVHIRRYLEVRRR